MTTDIDKLISEWKIDENAILRQMVVEYKERAEHAAADLENAKKTHALLLAASEKGHIGVQEVQDKLNALRLEFTKKYDDLEQSFKGGIISLDASDYDALQSVFTCAASSAPQKSLEAVRKIIETRKVKV